MNFLGDYDSDGEDATTASKRPSPAAAKPLGDVLEKEGSTRSPDDSDDDAKEEHDSFCKCEDCSTLLLRFLGKNLQTKGIRFKCKLSGQLFASKAEASGHFMEAYAAELQTFKKQKMPKLFQTGMTKEQLDKLLRQQAFAVDRVLGKRPADVDASFGGWAKKEKPAPAPCETEEYAEMMEDPVFTAPPWAQQRPSNDDATEMDKGFDKQIFEAQTTRFCKRNILEVKKDVVRCKLCYKTLGSTRECEAHIRSEHKNDFEKEIKIWERFLFTTCKRQPPFGWVCKICQIFFPSDGACWRHVGKEVYIRGEERHRGSWQDKEDRWGHEEDEECCGDGFNANGLSMESVMQIRRAEEAKAKADAAAAAQKKAQEEESSSSSDSEDNKIGKVQAIREF